MNTVLFPYHLKNNEYCDLVVRAMENQDIKVNKLSYTLKNPITFLRTEIINFNFYENIPNEYSFLKAMIVTILKIFFIEYCKVLKIKVIYTFHNKQQHDAKYIKLNKLLMYYMAKRSDLIFSLCSEGKEILLERYSFLFEDKIKVVPLPAYSANDIKSKKFLNSLSNNYDAKNKMTCLFFGGISPYKNVDLIVEAANYLKDKDILFYIVGKPRDDLYLKSLKDMCQSKNVVWDSRFIPNEELNAYIEFVDVVLFPFDTKSSLNSSSVINALSKGKTCILPNIGTVRDIENKDCMFTYTYDSNENHLYNLIDCIDKAYSIYLNDSTWLRAMGKKLQDEVLNVNSLERIGIIYKQSYEGLMKE